MIYLTSFIIFLINTLGSNAQEIADVYKNVTLAHQYEQDFHVVFGMILSTMLIMGTFLLIAVITIWGMDPGRDSIIYRMTNQRVKKDN